MTKLWTVCLICILFGMVGCQHAPSRPKFALTMIYPDGTRKTFVGMSVHRDNIDGTWSYCFINERGFMEEKTFKGMVECRPVLDLTPAPVASETVNAEDPNAR